MNSILKAIRKVNELIIRESDLEKMLSESCTILREVREYFHVAIAVCGHKVEKVAESGQGGYFEVGEEIPLCVKKVINSERIEGTPIIFDDTKKHCGKCPYYKEEQRYSAALIPFNTREGLKLLVVFADINHFDSEEVELLREIADDIGFAVDKHTAEKERKITEKEKEEQQKLLRTIVNSTPDFVVFKDRNLVYKMVNKSFCQFVGKTQEELAKEKNPEVVLKNVCEKLSLLYNFVFTSLRRDEELIPVESVGISFNSMNRIIGSCPSVSKAMEGHIMKMRADNGQCKQCTAEPHKYALSVPLIHDENRGVITVHSNSDFSQDEIKLLEKLSSNIAFALSAYEVEKDRRAVMEQLTQNLAQFDKSADRLRNPLAVILNSLELVEEIGVDNVLEIIRDHSVRIKKELDEMRKEEMRTYELTAESIKEV